MSAMLKYFLIGASICLISKGEENRGFSKSDELSLYVNQIFVAKVEFEDNGILDDHAVRMIITQADKAAGYRLEKFRITDLIYISPSIKYTDSGFSLTSEAMKKNAAWNAEVSVDNKFVRTVEIPGDQRIAIFKYMPGLDSCRLLLSRVIAVNDNEAVLRVLGKREVDDSQALKKIGELMSEIAAENKE